MSKADKRHISKRVKELEAKLASVRSSKASKPSGVIRNHYQKQEDDLVRDISNLKFRLSHL